VFLLCCLCRCASHFSPRCLANPYYPTPYIHTHTHRRTMLTRVATRLTRPAYTRQTLCRGEWHNSTQYIQYMTGRERDCLYFCRYRNMEVHVYITLVYCLHLLYLIYVLPCCTPWAMSILPLSLLPFPFLGLHPSSVLSVHHLFFEVARL